jgi:hypothetical protein
MVHTLVSVFLSLQGLETPKRGSAALQAGSLRPLSRPGASARVPFWVEIHDGSFCWQVGALRWKLAVV